jgi:hypothetical protein
MATFIIQGIWAPTSRPMCMHAVDAVAYELTSAANGTALTGSGDVLVVQSSTSGWLHVSTTVDTDKAASLKTHRIIADQVYPIGGVGKGQFVSFLADV